jgi:hypothetical protein
VNRLAVLLLAGVIGGCASTPNTATPVTTPRAGDSLAPRSLGEGGRQQWLDMFARGYFPGRSGQVFVVNREGDIVTERDPLYQFMHGSPWDYDTRIPILFYGAPFVRQVEGGVAVQQDVAPTLGAIIGAPATSTYTGRVLANAIAPGAGRPRVVLLMVLDAMRADYFDKHADVMPTLTRMRREGAWFAGARTNVLPTVTGVGHATIGTGTDPRFHGITVNNLFNLTTGKSQPAYDALDPRELMALTLADTWNLATDGKAVIIGQGGAIRATAGLVGRGSCLVNGRKVIAASYASDSGWETNPACYSLSPALKPFLGKTAWEAVGGTWMGHDIASPSKFRASATFQKFEAEALLAVMNHEPIGADDITDLVMVNMKGPDYTAHAHGPASPELRATLTELDKQMAAILALVDAKAGRGRSVVAVTADHGMPGVPRTGGRHYTDEIIPLLNKKFDPEGKIVQYYADAANGQMYLDTARLRSLGFSLKDVANFLETIDIFVAAFTEDEVRGAQARLR